MVRASKVQNRGADNHQLFLLGVDKSSAQRIIPIFGDDPLPDPLPKLLLGSPVLLAVLTQNQRIVLLTLSPTFLLQLLFVVFFISHRFQKTRPVVRYERIPLIPITLNGKSPIGDTSYVFLKSKLPHFGAHSVAVAVTVTVAVIAVAVTGRDLDKLLVERMHNQFEATIHL